jgi:hypothetical protein
MRAPLFFLTLCLASSGCRRVTPTAAAPSASATLLSGSFVTAPGEYRGSEGRFTRIVKLTDRGSSIAWSITTEKKTSRSSPASSTSTSALNLANPTVPWFVYVESPTRLWLYDGHANLTASFVSNNGSNEFHQLLNSGHRTTKDKPLPAEVFQRLRESLRSLFPAPAEPERRPSF